MTDNLLSLLVVSYLFLLSFLDSEFTMDLGLLSS